MEFNKLINEAVPDTTEIYTKSSGINLNDQKNANDYLVNNYLKTGSASGINSTNRKSIDMMLQNLSSFNKDIYEKIKDNKPTDPKALVASLFIVLNAHEKKSKESVANPSIELIKSRLLGSNKDLDEAKIEKMFSDFLKLGKSSIEKILKDEVAPIVPVEEPAAEKPAEEKEDLNSTKVPATEEGKEKSSEGATPSTPVSTTTSDLGSSYMNLIAKIPDTKFSSTQLNQEMLPVINDMKKRIVDTLASLESAYEKLSKQPANEETIFEAIDMNNLEEVEKFRNLYKKASEDFEKATTEYLAKSTKLTPGAEFNSVKDKIALKIAAIKTLQKLAEIDRNVLKKELPSVLQTLKSGFGKLGKEIANTATGKAVGKIASNIKSSVNNEILEGEIKTYNDFMSEAERAKIQENVGMQKADPNKYYSEIVKPIIEKVKSRVNHPQVKIVRALIKSEKNESIGKSMLDELTKLMQVDNLDLAAIKAMEEKYVKTANPNIGKSPAEVNVINTAKKGLDILEKITPTPETKNQMVQLRKAMNNPAEYTGTKELSDLNNLVDNIVKNNKKVPTDAKPVAQNQEMDVNAIRKPRVYQETAKTDFIKKVKNNLK